MEHFEFLSESENSTRDLGKAIGEKLTPGFALGLNGTLGTGKTRLSQAIAIGLGIKEGNVVSPTYTIFTPHQGRLLMVHLDAYRIRSDEEVDEFGLDELVEDGAVIVVEWANRIQNLAPEFDVIVEIEQVSETGRKFSFRGRSKIGQQLLKKTAESMA